jgi:hypothetical protein
MDGGGVKRRAGAKIKMPPRGCRVGRDSWRTGKVGTHTVAAGISMQTLLHGDLFGCRKHCETDVIHF